MMLEWYEKTALYETYQHLASPITLSHQRLSVRGKDYCQQPQAISFDL